MKRATCPKWLIMPSSRAERFALCPMAQVLIPVKSQFDAVSGWTLATATHAIGGKLRGGKPHQTLFLIEFNRKKHETLAGGERRDRRVRVSPGAR
jgi:hypothetical protein